MTKVYKSRWFWLVVCIPVMVCGAVLVATSLTTPTAQAYSAYDYYPGAACNGMAGDPVFGAGLLPKGQKGGTKFVCPIVRIYPRTKDRLESAYFEMDVNKAPATVQVCARRDDTTPLCAVEQVSNTGRQEISLDYSDLAEVRDSGEFGWDYYLYAVVELSPGDKLHGYKVLWTSLE